MAIVVGMGAGNGGFGVWGWKAFGIEEQIRAEEITGVLIAEEEITTTWAGVPDP